MQITTTCGKCGVTYERSKYCGEDVSFMRDAIHECSQSRLHHADMPGIVIGDNSDGEWQKLELPLDYETKKPVGKIYEMKCEKCNQYYFEIFTVNSDLAAFYFPKHSCKEPE